MIKSLLVVVFVVVLLRSAGQGQKEMCLTVDDLPVVSYGISDPEYQEAIMGKLVGAMVDNSVPAIGFVNASKMYENGSLSPQQEKLLQEWAGHGLDLGNHTFSHPDYDKVSFAEFTADILAGEPAVKKVLEANGKTLRYFRHPYLHTGNTQARADSLTAFLEAHGYTVAPVTIDNQDYVFAKAYHMAMQQGDTVLMQKIGGDYVAYMSDKISFYERLSDSLFGRNIKQVLLVHASLVNADYAGELIRVCREKGYAFVSLDEALQDPAYQSPITVYLSQGISWIDRWALSQGKKGAFFAGEPDVPEYLRDMGK